MNRGSSDQLIVRYELSDKGDTAVAEPTLLKGKTIFSGVVVFLASALSVSPAIAQDSSQAVSTIEEIIVTARKREESIQDIPVSIVALSGEELRTLQVRQAQEIAQFMPNVIAHTATGDSQVNYFIRGVGDANFHTNSVGAVGLYFDEVSINSPVSGTVSLFDMERVEVLRGPQNTLYGRNTTGGAVNFISNKPKTGQDINGNLSVTYGRKDELNLEGAIGFPLGERAAARVALISQNRDGIFENPVLGARNDIERNAGRAQIIFELTDDIEIMANVHGGVNRGSNRPTLAIGTQDPNDPTMPCPVPTASLSPDSPCVDGAGFPTTSDFSKTFGTSPIDSNDIDVWGGFISIDWNFNDLTLTSISSYDSNKMVRAEETDDSPSFVFEFHQHAKTKQWSQDIRLASSGDQRFRWIIGGNYFFEEADYDTVVRRTPPGTPIGFIPGGSFTILPSTVVDQDNEAISVYGQGEYDINEKWKIEAGIRYTNETKKGTNQPYVGNGFQFTFGTQLNRNHVSQNPLFVPPVNPLDGDWSEWGGKVSLDYKYSDDTLIFGSVSRGFKGGGFGIPAFQALTGNGGTPVDPEILVTYELGVKTQWLDRKLQINAAVFDNEWSFQQLFTLANTTAGLTPLLVNVPESRTYGFEIETLWVPADGWFFQVGFGMLASEVQDSTNLPNVAVGNTLPSSPGFTVNGLFRREFQLAEGLVAAQLDFSYLDDQQFTIENTPEKTQNGYGIVNARVSYAFGPENRYELAIWGKNLTDTEFCQEYGELRGGFGESIPCIRSDALVTYGISASVFFD